MDYMMIYTHVLLLTLVYMTLWYCVALYMRDNSIVDIAWGTAFVLMAWMTLLYYEPVTWKGILVTSMVTVWGIRLSAHITARHSGEDPRYAQWRKQWTYVKLRSFLQIFMLQGVIATIVCLPVMYINVSQASLTWWDGLGSAIWMTGFICEVIADWQLQRFIEANTTPGAIMQSGLWRYSRHPNYFGESLLWWGIWIMACALPYGWILIISPALITYLVVYVSGIPMNEAQFADNPEYQKYKQRTSAFIPMPPQQ